MKNTLVIAALVHLTSTLAFAKTNEQTFDCATLTETQAQSLKSNLSSENLKDLAKTCDAQAATFQRIAREGESSLPSQDLALLYEKAAHAYLRVATFTNDSLMK